MPKSHLPLLTVPNNTPRTELQAASVEFCDLSRPNLSSNDITNNHYDAFRAKRTFFPRISHKNTTRASVPAAEGVSQSCPIFNYSKHKVPTRFTEGLSSLSIADIPLYSVQRNDIIAANLPTTIKLSQERNKAYLSIHSINTHYDKPTITLTKPKNSRGRAATNNDINVSNVRNPTLTFAPDVFDDLTNTMKVAQMTERSVTPYYPTSKQPKQYDIIPKIVCVGLSLNDDLLDTETDCLYDRQKPCSVTSSKHYQAPMNSQSMAMGNSLPKIQISLPPSILRHNSSMKFNTRTSCGLPPIEFSKYDSEQNTTLKPFSFVVKMPRTNDLDPLTREPTRCDADEYNNNIGPWASFASSSKPLSIDVDQYVLNRSDTELNSCRSHDNNNNHTTAAPSNENVDDSIAINGYDLSDFTQDTQFPIEVDIINTTKSNRQVTTQMYSRDS